MRINCQKSSGSCGCTIATALTAGCAGPVSADDCAAVAPPQVVVQPPPAPVETGSPVEPHPHRSFSRRLPGGHRSATTPGTCGRRYGSTETSGDRR
jgi:hypothetical protein